MELKEYMRVNYKFERNLEELDSPFQISSRFPSIIVAIHLRPSTTITRYKSSENKNLEKFIDHLFRIGKKLLY